MVRERFEREQIFLLGTLREDGSPRISGVEVDFAAGNMFAGMIWQSAKAVDLLRDPRMTIHSLVPDKEHESENQGDLKLYGRAIPVDEPELKGKYEDTIEARIDWRPSEPYHCFAFDIEHVGMVRFVDDARSVWSWTPASGLTKKLIPEMGPPG